jgi:aspartate-semialdehyde dehydrogenase
MKIAVVGVTGLVGKTILKVLEERNFPVSEIYGVASEKSIGRKFVFRKKNHEVISMAEGISKKPEIAIFSAGGTVSRSMAPVFAKNGTIVIDNSSAWRMDADIPLIVPEVNGHILKEQHRIISNPNCSTIQMVAVLGPLHKSYRIKRIVVSTYQSVTGSGYKAVKQLENERKGIEGSMFYKYRIDLNCLPHGGDFLENGYTTEEMKLVNETKKILGDDRIRVTATVVRVPVMGGHSESVNVEFWRIVTPEPVKKLLSETKGIVVQDDPESFIYPMPYYSNGKDEVFVGRIRRDNASPRTLNMWIVADNLRKGAATNAVQIAEFLRDSKIIRL